ncbi:26S proteasome non-ATPase regulatory subunit [Sorochytrium milnesiophthora]
MDIDTPSADKQQQQQQQPEAGALVLADIVANAALLEKAVALFESRFTTRVLRSTNNIRKRITGDVLAKAITRLFPAESAGKSALLGYLDSNAMEVETDAAKSKPVAADKFLPEVEVYLSLLVLLHLSDNKKNEQGVRLSSALLQQVQSQNRRTLDPLSARVYFYYAHFHELTGHVADIRGTLLASQRTATLRHDVESQAMLLNLLLRNYLHYNLYEQADKLISKSTFPETADNNQTARYMYYMGRIKAIQLDYTSSHQFLQQAIRKSPQTTASIGFQQAATKLSIIVQLLMGEIPERSVFRPATLRKSLQPYQYITQAVRTGNLAQFQDTLSKYMATFKTDKTYTLILRLRHNVIKTGIRMISLSYSRISLRDICLKLHLDSEEDAEYIVSKAIRDGVIDATLDHERGYMKSKENSDVYTSAEPLDAFHQRITFCVRLHNDSVKAMRYPLERKRDHAAVDEEVLALAREIAKEIAEGGADADDADD